MGIYHLCNGELKDEKKRQLRYFMEEIGLPIPEGFLEESAHPTHKAYFLMPMGESTTPFSELSVPQLFKIFLYNSVVDIFKYSYQNPKTKEWIDLKELSLQSPANQMQIKIKEAVGNSLYMAKYNKSEGDTEQPDKKEPKKRGRPKKATSNSKVTTPRSEQAPGD